MATVMKQKETNQDEVGPRMIRPKQLQIYRNEQREVYASLDGDEVGPLSMKQAFPLTDPDRFVILKREDDGKFVGMIKEFTRLDDASLAVVAEELERHYFLPKIQRVHKIDERFRIMFWDVETDRGPRTFEVKSRKRDIRWLSDQHIVIRDVDGNKYEIPNFANLDEDSRELIEMEV